MIRDEGNLSAIQDAIGPEFRPIPGFDGYEIADGGIVRSYRIRGTTRRRDVPVVIGGGIDPASGYPSVHLRRDGKDVSARTHKLLMLAFVGPRPEGLEVRHLNGDQTDCRLANLAYGTRAENCLDKRLTHVPISHCKWGHPYDAENTYHRPDGERGCRACGRAAVRKYRLRRAGAPA